MTVFLDDNIVNGDIPDERIVPDHGEKSQKSPVRHEFPLPDCKKG